MAILVTGGAGYIGSHMVAELIEKQNAEVVVVDSLIKGHRAAVWPSAKFYEGNISDRDVMHKVFTENDITAVVHFAAFSLVAESVQHPSMYYANNVLGTYALLQTMHEFGVKHIVFSSTAAVYGVPETVPITEDTPVNPINPYGETKLAVERMLQWYSQAYEMDYVALRYFNVAGAHESASIGEAHNPETHLLPIVLQTAQGKRDALDVYGSDYPTADGTCIRDYIHVMDLVNAHILALNYLQNGGSSTVYNLGSGEGFSNMEIVKEAKKITNVDFTVNIKDRRPGDPPTLIASSEKIKRELGWNPTRTNMESIISSAWAWHTTSPDGYAK